ncbi:MAG TPA: methyltransferase domain-containing protein [Opitutaceae bacterium]|nr:methyltransferase domain-containing protein [Opitutaceae bacterium]
MTTEPVAGTRGAVTCRCCGSGPVTYVGRKRGKFLVRDFDFWRCPACDYMFVEPFSGYAVYDKAYYEGRGADPCVDYESEHRDYRSTDRMMEFDDLWRIASGFIEDNIPEGAVEWLDFGCGAGGLLRYLTDKGAFESGGGRWPIRVAGSDVGAYAERLRVADGLRILGIEQLASEPAGSYDVVSMIEVVEHIEFPDPVFALAARLLKPGGLLLLTTGNLSGPVPRMRGLGYAYVIPEVHVGYFTPRALETSYARHGLRPVSFRYDGVVRFKVLKTLRTSGKQRIARMAMALPLVVRAFDGLFGTSRMPCAVKPR